MVRNSILSVLVALVLIVSAVGGERSPADCNELNTFITGLSRPNVSAPTSAAGVAGSPGVEATAGGDEAEYLRQLMGLKLFSDCRSEGSFMYYKQWYASHAPIHRVSAQFVAILVIVLGAILSLILHIENLPRYKLVVSAIGAAIVISQGVSQAFNNDGSWKGYTLAKMNLEFAYTSWQHAIIKAMHMPNGLIAMENATDNFEAAVKDSVIFETNGFFMDRKKPSVSMEAKSPPE